jgi:hypothetical protein
MVRLSTGESHQGWVLRSVHGREAMLEKDGRQETVTLPVPGDGSAATVSPRAPVMTGAPGMAAMFGAPTMPGAQGTPPPGVPETPVIPENGRWQSRRSLGFPRPFHRRLRRCASSATTGRSMIHLDPRPAQQEREAT